MFKLLCLVILSLTLSSFSYADNDFYLNLGTSIHDVSGDSPEVALEKNLGFLELEYAPREDIIFGFRHTSALLQNEKGNGLNELFIKLRLKIWLDI